MATNFGLISGTYFASEAALAIHNEKHDIISHAGAGALSGGLLARIFGGFALSCIIISTTK
jgi:hypothetical protein